MMIDPELLETLEKRYGTPEIPPCRICGEEMTISKMGGGEPTIFRCGSDHASFIKEGGPCLTQRKEDMANGIDPPHGSVFAPTCEHLKHYRDSEWKLYQHGDRDVMELVRYVQWLQGTEPKVL